MKEIPLNADDILNKVVGGAKSDVSQNQPFEGFTPERPFFLGEKTPSLPIGEKPKEHKPKKN